MGAGGGRGWGVLLQTGVKSFRDPTPPQRRLSPDKQSPMGVAFPEIRVVIFDLLLETPQGSGITTVKARRAGNLFPGFGRAYPRSTLDRALVS